MSTIYENQQIIPSHCTGVIVDACDCSIHALREGLGREGFDYALPQREDGTVLRSVATELSKDFCPEGSRFRMESRDNPKENGYELVMVTPGDDGNAYQCLALVKIDSDRTIYATRFSGIVPDSFESRLREVFPRELDRMDSSCVTRLLIQGVERHRGFSMRRAGGVYAVPKAYSESFERFVGCINNAAIGGKLNLKVIKLPDDPVTSASTAASCIQHIMDECNSLGLELEEMQSRGTRMRSNGEATRLGRISTLRETLSHLSEIIGPAFSTCSDAIQHCENLVLAVNAREYAQTLAIAE